MDKSEAIASVDDAIRKLVQLSSKEKVWAQEMLLQVNDKSLRLLDMGTQVSAASGQAEAGPDVQFIQMRVALLVCGREWSEGGWGKVDLAESLGPFRQLRLP